MPEPHLSPPSTIPHGPLLEVSVKPAPVSEAVKVAHVPVVNQVPLLMIQPVCIPLATVTSRYPFPAKGAPGALVGAEDVEFEEMVVVVRVGEAVGLLVVGLEVVALWEVEVDEVVGTGEPDLGL